MTLPLKRAADAFNSLARSACVRGTSEAGSRRLVVGDRDRLEGGRPGLSLPLRPGGQARAFGRFVGLRIAVADEARLQVHGGTPQHIGRAASQLGLGDEAVVQLGAREVLVLDVDARIHRLEIGDQRPCDADVGGRIDHQPAFVLGGPDRRRVRRRVPGRYLTSGRVAHELFRLLSPAERSQQRQPQADQAPSWLCLRLDLPVDRQQEQRDGALSCHFVNHRTEQQPHQDALAARGHHDEIG